jgi:dihydroorotase
MGSTNNNLDELLRLDPKKVCGVKIFMGSSTGNMVVDNPVSLENIFKEVKLLIATHCEDDPMIKQNQQKFIEQFGADLDIKSHHLIRSEAACYKSSSFAVELSRKHDTRLHILHISTAKELSLFDNKNLRQTTGNYEINIQYNPEWGRYPDDLSNVISAFHKTFKSPIFPIADEFTRMNLACTVKKHVSYAVYAVISLVKVK